MVPFIGFCVLALVAWLTYRWVFKTTENRLVAGGASIASLGVFLIVVTIGLHAALGN